MKERVRLAGLLGGLGILLNGCAPPRAGLESWPHQAVSHTSYRTSALGGRVPQQPEEFPEQAGLRDYLAYAALNNPGLEAAFNRWKAALERVPQVKALPDPRFTYRYFIREIETRVGAQRQGFGLGQAFPWLGKLQLRGSAAMADAQVERHRYEAARLKLFYEVKDAYCEYYYLGRSIAVVTESIRLLKHMEQVARTRYKASAASHPDVIRAQVELGKLDDRLRSLKELRAPVVADLNAALNRPAATPLGWPKNLAEEQAAATDDQLLAWMAESNPEVRAMDAAIVRRRHQIELARKDYLPDVTLSADFVETASSTSGRHPADDGKDAVSATISLNIPIWREKLRAGVREARHRHFAAVLARRQRINSLSASMKLVLHGFRDAERKVKLYRDTLIPKAAESIKTTEAAFRAGKAGFLDVIDSQRVLLEFELAAERALVNKAQRLAELEMIVGRPIPRAKSPKAAQDTKAGKHGEKEVGGDSHE